MGLFSSNKDRNEYIDGYGTITRTTRTMCDGCGALSDNTTRNSSGDPMCPACIVIAP